MSDLDDLFNDSNYDHPKLRSWAARIDGGERAVVEVRRPWDGITRRPSELFIEFRSAAGEILGVESAPWEDGLNSALIQKGVRARSLSDEAERLAVALQTSFEPIVMRYGDGYFNSVLLELMQDMGMTGVVDVTEVTQHVTTYSPDKASASFEDCRNDIKASLQKVARGYTERLRYLRPEATDILTAALARFLDERFSVTSRRKLGWAGESAGFWTQVRNLAPSFPGASKALQWTASAADIADYLRSRGFHTTAVTVERELLDHAADDASFPWIVTLDPNSGVLVFEPK